MADIVWLHDAGIAQTPLIGAKAARLGELARQGFPVPPAFCVTTDACAGAASVTAALRQDILTACARLAEQSPAGPLFAVRSSSPVEDLASSSFAGQYDTFLNVALSDVPARVAACCASASSQRAAIYRQQHGMTAGAPPMSVLVQAMIPCQVAGVVFSRDPLTGEEAIVIEAAHGLGEQVVGGTTTPHRYTILPDSSLPEGDDVLSSAALQQLAGLAPSVERALGGPQDIEWGFWNNTIFVLQARPITVAPTASSIFTDPSDADTVWTSGFFNERFAQPVSPLGWSVLQGLIERYALCETLQFLGAPDCEQWPLTRLYHGHPYANMRVFQTIYKVFPDSLLPEDALRFFINRDAGLRRKVPYPRSVFDPRFLFSMLRHFVRDARNWSPLHNWRLWQDFTSAYDAGLLKAREQSLSDAPENLLAVAADIQKLNGRLLAIHRWSLTDADIFYSLLRRVLRWCAGRTEGEALAAELTAGVGNLSLDENTALATLQRLAATDPALINMVDKNDDIAATPGGQQFLAARASFVERFGHRSSSLDIYHPPLAADPALLAALLQPQSTPLTIKWRDNVTQPLATEGDDCRRCDADERLKQALAHHVLDRLLPLRALLVRWLLGMNRHYLPLRENQRFYWQKGLALLRRIYLALGSKLEDQGILAHADDVFFLTVDEVSALTSSCPLPPAPAAPDSTQAEGNDKMSRTISERRTQFARLMTEWTASPALAYPLFLQGNKPVTPAVVNGNTLKGQPVSPGIARGLAFVVLHAHDAASAPSGCILVVPSADPAWTPLFPRLAGLVLEVGGQLSHGAVVAREYGLPAVAAIPGVTSSIHSGDEITVDGNSGIVIRHAKPK